MSRRDRLTALSLVSGTALAASVLLRFPPEQYAFYPRCPVHEYLHLECPGCGATRACAALLHGNIRGALDHNALVIAFLALSFIYVVICCYQASNTTGFRWLALPSWLPYALLAITAVFTVARNLPG